MFLLNFIRRIREYSARQKARYEKLDTMFQPGRQVRSVESGRVYNVLWVDLNAAMLAGENGTRFIVDWFTPGGTIRADVADVWDPVPGLGA